MQLIPYRKGKLLGFCLPDKTIVVEPQFEEVMPFKNGFAKVKLQGKWGVIQENGTYAVVPKYDLLDSNTYNPNNFGVDRIMNNGKWGLLIDNVEVFPPKYYTPIGCMDDGSFRIETQTKISYVNLQKAVISKEEKLPYQNISGSNDWFFTVDGILNFSTKKIIKLPQDFDTVERFLPFQSLFVGSKVVNEYSLSGLFDTDGETLLTPTYIGIWDNYDIESKKFIRFREKNDKIGLLNSNGQVVLNAIYIEILWINDDLFLVKSDLEASLYFININNEKVKPAFLPENAKVIFYDVTRNRIEYISADKNYIYTEIGGKLLLSLPMNEMQPINDQINFNNYGYVCTKKHTYIQDLTLENILKIDFPANMAWMFNEHYLRHEKEGKVIAYNINKKQDIPYEIIQEMSNIYIIKDEKGFGFMDKNEKITIPTGQIQYDHNQLFFDNFAAFSVSYDDGIHFYWIDVLNNIVYAEGLEDIKDTPKNQIIIPNFIGKVYDLETFKMPYFEDFEKDTNQKDYQTQVEVNGVNVGVSITLGEQKLDNSTRFLIRNALEKIVEIDNLMLKVIQKDFKSKGWAKENVDHFLRESDKAFIGFLLENCNKKQSKQLQMLSIIRMKYFRIRLDLVDKFIWLDYAIHKNGSYPNNNVLTMDFNEKGEMLVFTMES
jgi:WG containing repeat